MGYYKELTRKIWFFVDKDGRRWYNFQWLYVFNRREKESRISQEKGSQTAKPEERCVERMREPDFEAVYQNYYYAIFSFVRSHVEQREAAQDLTGNIFLAVYKNWDKFDPEISSVSTWIYCIARNHLKNYYRNKKDEVSLEALGDGELMESLEDPSQPYRLLELREVLAQALNQLPDRDRKVLVLRYFAGRSNQEIAAELGLSHENTRVILSRTLKKLKTILIKNGFSLEE